MEQMEALEWKNRILELAEKAGFVAVGFTGAEPVEGLKEFLEERHKLGWHSAFEEKEIIKRVDPKASWPACETIVALAFPLPFSKKPQEGEGILARSAVGEDYHTRVKMALANLVSSIEGAGWPGEKPRTQVDTGSLNERAFATRAGLGWLGKNQQLIIPGVGSFVALALLLLDQRLPPDKPIMSQCGECTRCIQACPAQILGYEHFQANRCLSYLTQSKEPLSEEQQSSLGKRIFGCDTCQEACPHNHPWLSKEAQLEIVEEVPKEYARESAGEGLYKDSKVGDGLDGNAEEGLKTKDTAGENSARETPPRKELVKSRGVDLWATLNLTKGQFNKEWKSSAAGWRGKSILQRNAYLALKNLRDPHLRQWEEERKKEELSTLLRHYIIKRGN